MDLLIKYKGKKRPQNKLRAINRFRSVMHFLIVARLRAIAKERSAIYFSFLFILFSFTVEQNTLAETSPEILTQSDQWTLGNLDQLHEKVLFTHNSHKWADPEARALAIKMREAIIAQMLTHSPASEVVKYLTHYLNIDHASDRTNFMPSMGMPGRGFIPRSQLMQATAHLQQNTAHLSSKELAKVIAMDSLAGTSSQNTKYEFPQSVIQRLEQEKDPNFVLLLMEAFGAFPPLKNHPGIDEIEKRIPSLGLEQLAKINQRKYKIFDVDSHDRSPYLKKSIPIIKEKLLARVNDLSPENIHPTLLETLITMQPTEQNNSINPTFLQIFKATLNKASIADIFLLLSRIENEELSELIETSLQQKKPEEVLTFSKNASRDENGIERKAIAFLHLYSRKGEPNYSHFHAYQSLLEYIQSIGNILFPADSLPSAIKDFLPDLSPYEILKILKIKNNTLLHELIRNSIVNLPKETRIDILTAMAQEKETDHAGWNQQLALWKSSALDLANDNTAMPDKSEKRKLIHLILKSTLLSHSIPFKEIQNKSLIDLEKNIPDNFFQNKESSEYSSTIKQIFQNHQREISIQASLSLLGKLLPHQKIAELLAPLNKTIEINIHNSKRLDIFNFLNSLESKHLPYFSNNIAALLKDVFLFDLAENQDPKKIDFAISMAEKYCTLPNLNSNVLKICNSLGLSSLLKIARQGNIPLQAHSAEMAYKKLDQHITIHSKKIMLCSLQNSSLLIPSILIPENAHCREIPPDDKFPVSQIIENAASNKPITIDHIPSETEAELSNKPF